MILRVRRYTLFEDRAVFDARSLGESHGDLRFSFCRRHAGLTTTTPTCQTCLSPHPCNVYVHVYAYKLQYLVITVTDLYIVDLDVFDCKSDKRIGIQVFPFAPQRFRLCHTRVARTESCTYLLPPLWRPCFLSPRERSCTRVHVRHALGSVCAVRAARVRLARVPAIAPFYRKVLARPHGVCESQTVPSRAPASVLTGARPADAAELSPAAHGWAEDHATPPRPVAGPPRPSGRAGGGERRAAGLEWWWWWWWWGSASPKRTGGGL